MTFHEKTLELNITHEILDLADKWYWFFIDSPLWKYWTPGYRAPFTKYMKAVASGFHITTEGKNDPSGNAGGGYDVRIKAGNNSHLLFIQYKKGELVATSPSDRSIFQEAPQQHFKFKINSKSTNQHFLLRELGNAEGGKVGNAVVYALPLIADMNELERNAGKLIRKTKFISIKDIDNQAESQTPPKPIKENYEHNFRVCLSNMDRCEVNYDFFQFYGKDRAPEIIADIIAIQFRKILLAFVKDIEYNIWRKQNVDLFFEYSFYRYLTFLLHYFEVDPDKLNSPFSEKIVDSFFQDEHINYENSPRDIEIVSAIFKALNEIIDIRNNEIVIPKDVPVYKPRILFESNEEVKISITENKRESLNILNDLSYLIV
ncbi:hypothetical protein QE382_003180 [Sphingobacterium zeae]|uniref:Uncharacterized protein n=1 Tax=Sphingobacterium zeae TaxID=1776859 RepID=A0ABU0U940_9SPHI|nr:hypothetical protein [Sphingobacterium zeae]MDQ1151196.1 hypothetical protein [Sphingobacterium zeae]